MDTLTITRPDDWHIHLRDGKLLTRTVADIARQVQRAIIMPNLLPPVTQMKEALSYRSRILTALPATASFEPLMTLYLTDETRIKDIEQVAASSEVVACKWYPAGATTHSEAGVTRVEKIYPIIEAMAANGVPLLIHGEVTTPHIDIFDREAVFIETVLKPLLDRFTNLKVVLEHITTSDAVDFVMNGPESLAATITAHHLMLSRNDLFVGGIRPHHYCLPILKRSEHQSALIQAVISGSPRFFLGSDSAPHPRTQKESACGCAGIYTANALIPHYLSLFESADALDKFEAFASFHGADFYGLPRNTGKVTFIKKPWVQADLLPILDSEETIIPFQAAHTIDWSLSDDK